MENDNMNEWRKYNADCTILSLLHLRMLHDTSLSAARSFETRCIVLDVILLWKQVLRVACDSNIMNWIF